MAKGLLGIEGIVGRFLGDIDVVGVALLEAGGGYYPVIRAKDFYNLPGGAEKIEEGILMWLESGDCSYCLFVDELLGEQQIVVKPLPDRKSVV